MLPNRLRFLHRIIIYMYIIPSYINDKVYLKPFCQWLEKCHEIGASKLKEKKTLKRKRQRQPQIGNSSVIVLAVSPHLAFMSLKTSLIMSFPKTQVYNPFLRFIFRQNKTKNKVSSIIFR